MVSCDIVLSPKLEKRETLFTIITPVFNGANKIDATIQSVLSQAESLYEYLIIDGGSTDGTLDQVHVYGERIRWTSNSDLGVYDAMNKGICIAGGRYLYFLGAGDALKPGILAKVAKVVAATPVGLNLFYGEVNALHRKDLIKGGRFNKAKLCGKNICHQAIFYERTLFERLGHYEIAYKLAADWVFNMRCYGDQAVRKIYIPMTIAEYEGGGISEHSEDLQFDADQHRLKREHLGLVNMWRERCVYRIVWLWNLRRFVFNPRLAIDRLAGRRFS